MLFFVNHGKQVPPLWSCWPAYRVSISHLTASVGLLACVFFFGIFFSTAYAAPHPRTLRVAFFPIETFQQRMPKGTYYGYSIDYLNEIAKFSNWKYEYVPCSWQESLDKLEAGEIDLVGGVMYSKERAEKYGFPDLNCGITHSTLFVSVDSPLQPGVFKYFDNIRVGALLNSANLQALQRYADHNGFSVQIVSFKTYEEIKDAVVSGTIDAGVCSFYQASPLTRPLAQFSPLPFYFVTRKNDPLLGELNNALSAVKITNPNFDSDLHKRYSSFKASMELSDAEKEYLQNARPLRVLFRNQLHNDTQFKIFSESPVLFISGLLKLLSERSGLKFEIVKNDSDAVSSLKRGQSDLIAAVIQTPKSAEEEGLMLTMPYFSVPVFRITRMGTSPACRQYAVPAALNGLEFPGTSGIKRVVVETTEQAFEALRLGEVCHVYGDSYSINQLLTFSKYANFQRTRLKNVSLNLCIGLDSNENPLLRNLLNRAIQTLSPADINDLLIFNIITTQKTNLLSILRQLPSDVLSLFIALLMGISLLMLILLLIYRRSRNQIRTMLTHTQTELQFDALTGLYSKMGFFKHTKEIIRKGTWKYVTLVDFDINHFREYNELNGYTRGNELLCRIATLLENYCRGREIASRFEGDHFMLLFLNRSLEAIQKRLDALNTQLRERERNNMLLISYGIFEVTDATLDIATMCDRASVAKRTIKGSYDRYIAVYDKEIHEGQIEDVALISGMEAALKCGQFVPYYQPKYDLRTGRIYGAEALARWVDSSNNLIQPSRFIDLFERNGLIRKLDRHLFECVCQNLAKIRSEGLMPVPISVNFSRANLYQSDFIEHLVMIADRHEVPHHLLEIEFTESIVYDHRDTLKKTVEHLHRHGFKVSVDDFGSGFSSLNMLKDTEFDIIKIDREFLNSYATNPKSAIVIECILDLAQKLVVTSLAEGVETQNQVEFLKNAGCELAQGFYFARPMPENNFHELFKPSPAAS